MSTHYETKVGIQLLKCLLDLAERLERDLCRPLVFLLRCDVFDRFFLIGGMFTKHLEKKKVVYQESSVDTLGAENVSDRETLFRFHS